LYAISYGEWQNEQNELRLTQGLNNVHLKYRKDTDAREAEMIKEHASITKKIVDDLKEVAEVANVLKDVETTST